MSTCNWCGSESDEIQSRGDTYLCPDCTPNLNPDEVPDNAPSSWNYMSAQEREAWRDGMSIEKIIHEFDWYSPPDRATDTINQ